jgi:acetolactate synthase-1/2/3 large subunit
MRVADYIARGIARLGVQHVFMVTGGGAMHLNDALGRRDDLTLVFQHHEQACAIAAEGYARITGGVGVACVTTGPGGTNAITGVLGQWHDSIPALFVSGQVRRDTTVASTDLPLRQLGDQEADIVRLVAPIAKYAVSIVEPSTVRFHFEKAVWLATHGRPGPVWLDVPVDVQASEVTPERLPGFDPNELAGDPGEDPGVAIAGSGESGSLRSWPGVQQAAQAPGAFSGRFDRDAAGEAARQVMERLRIAERPAILAGSAVRTGHCYESFLTTADLLGAPVCTAWNAADLLWHDHPLFAGRPGSVGDRAGNFALQNADVVLVLGCRLNVRQVGYEFPAFAHAAYRIVVDVDEAELSKPTIYPDLAVHADVGFFIEELRRMAELDPPAPHAGWVEWCRERRRRYPVVLPEYRRQDRPVNPYAFVERLGARLDEGDVIVCANGSACVVTIQALAMKRGQRLLVNSGTAGMGYDLPAAIGAAHARQTACLPRRRVVCLAGDGSVQMNIQELQTISQHRLPVKVFVFNNAGYASIRQTQDNLFGGHRVGEGPGSGLTFPDMVAVAEAYGIEANRVDRHDELDDAIGATLAGEGPALLDIVMDPGQSFVPKVAAERLPDGRLISKPLEDMTPLLDREEFADNMIVPPYVAPEG